jgi:polar amino acid transport system permease protein
VKSFFFARSSTAEPPISRPVQTLNFALVFLFITLVFYFSFNQLNYHWDWSSIYKYRQKFLQGWLTTVLISIIALGLSAFIGLFFALTRRTRFLPLRYFSMVYVEAVRGTPLLVQILIVFYVVAPAFHVGDRYLVGVLILSFFSGAYISEVIRAGLESVGKSQIESAKAVGLTRAQTYRYVIFPQALRQTLPPLAGQFVSLIKDSSLLSIIGLNEFTQNAREVNSYTFSSLEGYIPLAVGYLILTLPISLWTRDLEHRVKFET